MMDVYEVYRLTTDFNRRAPLLTDAQHGLTATDVFGLSASTTAMLKIDRAVLSSASPRLPDMRV